MKLSNEQNARIAHLYSVNKYSCNKIAVLVDLNRKTVANSLRKQGIILFKKKNKPPLSKDIQRKICEEYPFSTSVKLGAKYGVSFSTILTILRRNGLTIKKSGLPKRDQKLSVSSYHLTQAKRGAELRNLSFELTLDYISRLFDEQQGRCVFCGLELKVRKFFEDNSASASLDRIDSKKGYIEGNVQWVDKRINMMKGTLSDEEFVRLCKLVGEKNK